MQINNRAYANGFCVREEREALKGQLVELEIPLDEYLEELGYGA